MCFYHHISPQSAVHAGRIKVPPGYHPIDVEKEWGRIHVAILERERLLRIEFERWAAWIYELLLDQINPNTVFCSF